MVCWLFLLHPLQAFSPFLPECACSGFSLILSYLTLPAILLLRHNFWYWPSTFLTLTLTLKFHFHFLEYMKTTDVFFFLSWLCVRSIIGCNEQKTSKWELRNTGVWFSSQGKVALRKTVLSDTGVVHIAILGVLALELMTVTFPTTAGYCVLRKQKEKAREWRVCLSVPPFL